jgi:hypothetical protein
LRESPSLVNGVRFRSRNRLITGLEIAIKKFRKNEKMLLKMFMYLWAVVPRKLNLVTLQKPQEGQLEKADGFPLDEELADVK